MIRRHTKTMLGALVALTLAVVPGVAMATNLDLDAEVTVDVNANTSFTVPSATLDADGYVVIHEGSATEAGAVIGASALLEAGTHTDVTVELDRAIVDGEHLWVMVHVESNANTTFDGAEIDVVAVDTTHGNAELDFAVSFPVLANVEVQAGGPGFEGDIPTVGVALVMFEGGTVAELATAAEAEGVVSIGATVDGEWLMYVVGGPAFVNANFNAHFEAGVEALTPLVIMKR